MWETINFLADVVGVTWGIGFLCCMLRASIRKKAFIGPYEVNGILWRGDFRRKEY